MRHPRYLEMPWDIHWDHESTRYHRHLWWLIALLVVMALFLIGAGVMSGLM